VPLLWASCPLVRAPTPGPSGPLRAASARLGAAPTSPPASVGAWICSGGMVDGVCSAASTGGDFVMRRWAAPNLRHGLLVLGLPASLC